jgi:hypothetical protein
MAELAPSMSDREAMAIAHREGRNWPVAGLLRIDATKRAQMDAADDGH